MIKKLKKTLFFICLWWKGSSYLTGSSKLTVLISITSGSPNGFLRDTIRETWLKPCISSRTCDYRFFVDVNNENASFSLHEERRKYKDISLRNFCSLMSAHPADANYGNTGWNVDPVKLKNIREYKHRRRYKIDWKVCFMKWAVENNKLATYHVYVEDDFIVCTQNLIYQLSLLEQLRSSGAFIPSFRSGFAHNLEKGWFDDSSTIMTSDIVEAFALNYPSPLLSCDEMLLSTEPHIMRRTHFLAWGSSWAHCNWRTSLKDNFNISVIYPLPCMEELQQELKCDLLVVHEQSETLEKFLREMNVSQLEEECKRSLLLDTIKTTSTLQHVWNGTKSMNDFYDFSHTFLYEDKKGWQKSLQINNVKS